MHIYRHCRLCPRNCGADRLNGYKGYCGETGELRIAAASIHRGEEPPVTGTGGSGTIFITGCNLGCTFCQNHQISQNGMGKTVSQDEFVRICLALQEQKAENINIVTGSHAVPALVEGIALARSQGLALPVLWNSSGYESLEALSLLEDTIDIYLPDLKTLDKVIAGRFFNAPDYPEHAQKAIIRMMETRRLRFKPVRGTHTAPAVSGVIIRHLVLPAYLEATRDVLCWFAEYARDRALLSLMTQYTPVKQAGIDRHLNEKEYKRILQWLEEFGIEDGFYQELTPDTGWLPDFNRQNPFSSELSTPIWHWKTPEGAIPVHNTGND
ncbi:MAG: radical SAM protein [Treponema sp.]|nr:radical SAM protein [Treponema sp.]